MSKEQKKVAIIDFGMGNIFSVKLACEQVGLEAFLTQSKGEVFKADALILPGVGAFGDAMKVLKNLDLVDPIKESALSGKPFMGVCLGLQLLMTRSFEFGEHEGLNIIEGDVVPLSSQKEKVKIPQVGWNRISFVNPQVSQNPFFQDIPDGEYMYFVHSLHVVPKKRESVLTTTQYGENLFCSSLAYKNIFACQFHPERSGVKGLKIYENFAKFVSLKGF